MDAGKKNGTTVERASDREMIVRRSFDAPARLVFDAWTKPELLKRWWTPKSLGMSLVECAVDLRVGGKIRFLISHPSFPQPMEFFGHYREVVPGARLVWTNEEAGDNGQITTVTFEEKDGKTLVTTRELYPSKEALEAEAGACDHAEETYGQLDAIIAG